MARFSIKLPRAEGLCLLSKRACPRTSVGGLFYLCALFVFLPWHLLKRRSLTPTRKQPRPRKTDFSFLTRLFPISFSTQFIPPKEESGPRTSGPFFLRLPLYPVAAFTCPSAAATSFKSGTPGIS